MLPRDGTQFGDFWLVDRIAVGGLTEVHLAGAFSAEARFALQKVHRRLAEDAEFIRLWLEAQRPSARLWHDNVVRLFEVGERDGAYYSVHEYVHGFDLAWLGERARPTGPIPLSLALFIVCELLEALSYAHTQTANEEHPLHLAHGGIRPRKVSISVTGEVKLRDFCAGPARSRAAELDRALDPGWGYRAPEAADGAPPDVRSDIFSIGVVLFELLTGRHPSEAGTLGAQIARCDGRPEISGELEALQRRMLAACPDDRHPAAGDLLGELRALMAREGHVATRSDLATYAFDIRGRHLRPRDLSAWVSSPRAIRRIAAWFGDSSIETGPPEAMWTAFLQSSRVDPWELLGALKRERRQERPTLELIYTGNEGPIGICPPGGPLVRATAGSAMPLLIPPEGEFVIGRRESVADLVVHHLTLPGRAVRLYWRDGEVWIEDLNGPHGSSVSRGSLLVDRPSCPLRSGDRLRIARVVFEVRLHA